MRYYVPFDLTDESFNVPLVDCVRRELQNLDGVLSVDLLDNAYGRDLIVIELGGDRLTEEIVEALAELGDPVTEQMEEMGYPGWGEIYPEQAMPEWVRPKGKADAYMGGDIVFHNGAAFVSQVDENRYEPGGVSGGWDPVEFEYVWTE